MYVGNLKGGMMFNPFHKHKYISHEQVEYKKMYSNDWMIYNVDKCKCGHKIYTKMCGTINLSDIGLKGGNDG